MQAYLRSREGRTSLHDDSPVGIPLSRRRVPMERLSDGGHAVGQAVQAPRVQTQTSVSHVAAKKQRGSSDRALRCTITGLRVGHLKLS